jgi:hypothetical protein
VYLYRDSETGEWRNLDRRAEELEGILILMSMLSFETFQMDWRVWTIYNCHFISSNLLINLALVLYAGLERNPGLVWNTDPCSNVA